MITLPLASRSYLEDYRLYNAGDRDADDFSDHLGDVPKPLPALRSRRRWLSLGSAVVAPAVRVDDGTRPVAPVCEALLAHHAAHPLLAGDDPLPPEPRPDGPVAPGALPLPEHAPDLGPYVGVAVAPQACPVVLIGAPRYPQESGDAAEGQAGLPPRSLAELALAPGRG